LAEAPNNPSTRWLRYYIRIQHRQIVGDNTIPTPAFSGEDLEIAVLDGNLHEIEKIIGRLHETDIDLNNISGEETIIHSLFASGLDPLTETHILQVFLSLKDEAGNLIVDLNKVLQNYGSPLTKAIANNNLTAVQHMLEARNDDGTLACNLLALEQHGEFRSPLTYALFMNRQAIVAFLADIRDPDGSFRLAPDALINALNAAYEYAIDEGIWLDNESTRWLRDYLNEQNPLLLQARAANQFINNTHNSEVTISIQTSVNKLKNHYKTALDEVDKTLDKIKAYIKASNHHQKKYALACIERIEKDPTERVGIALTQSQVLALVWFASADKNATVEDQQAPLSNRDIDDKKSNIITNLADAQNEYGLNDPSCFVGTLNKIIETLDKTHPSVNITTGKETILSYAGKRISPLVKEALQNFPIQETIEVLNSWGNFNNDSLFYKLMFSWVDEKIKEEFQHLLTKEERESLSTQIEYMPKPTLAEAGIMEKLLKKIPKENKFVFEELVTKIPTENKNETRQAAIQCLIENHAYAIIDKNSSSAALKYFKADLEAFNDCDIFASSILEIKNKYQQKSAKELEAMDKIERSVNNCYRSLAQGTNAKMCETTLKEQVSQIRSGLKENYKTNGSWQFFGGSQPKHGLAKAIDEVFAAHEKNINSSLQARPALN
jgi:hypothetical protein